MWLSASAKSCSDRERFISGKPIKNQFACEIFLLGKFELLKSPATISALEDRAQNPDAPFAHGSERDRIFAARSVC
jgi:hypothetical protein